MRMRCTRPPGPPSSAPGLPTGGLYAVAMVPSQPPAVCADAVTARRARAGRQCSRSATARPPARLAARRPAPPAAPSPSAEGGRRGRAIGAAEGGLKGRRGGGPPSIWQAEVPETRPAFPFPPVDRRRNGGLDPRGAAGTLCNPLPPPRGWSGRAVPCPARPSPAGPAPGSGARRSRPPPARPPGPGPGPAPRGAAAAVALRT